MTRTKRNPGVFLFCIVVTAFGAREASAGRASETGLELCWLDAGGVNPPVARMTRRRVARIFESLDVSVAWTESVEPPLAHPGAVSVKIVLVPAEPTRWRLRRTVMGVFFSGGESSRVVHVFLPAVARTIGYRPEKVTGKPLPPEAQARLSRALSRVIAHEIVHAVAPELPHAHEGITQQHLGRDRLLVVPAFVEQRAADVFRRELSRLAAKERRAVVAAER